jgi:hypothetical protein
MRGARVTFATGFSLRRVAFSSNIGPFAPYLVTYSAAKLLEEGMLFPAPPVPPLATDHQYGSRTAPERSSPLSRAGLARSSAYQFAFCAMDATNRVAEFNCDWSATSAGFDAGVLR